MSSSVPPPSDLLRVSFVFTCHNVMSDDIYWLECNRKQLKKGVLLYIHINFIIALGLALLLFVTGIETAAKIRVHKSVDICLTLL